MASIDLPKITPEYLAADRSRALINIGIAFVVLDTFFVSLFFFSRIKCRIPIGIDGWLMIPGYLLCLAHCIGDFRKSSALSPQSFRPANTPTRHSTRQIRPRWPSRRHSDQSPDKLVAQICSRRRLHLLPLDLVSQTRLPVSLPQDFQ